MARQTKGAKRFARKLEAARSKIDRSGGQIAHPHEEGKREKEKKERASCRARDDETRKPHAAVEINHLFAKTMLIKGRGQLPTPPPRLIDRRARSLTPSASIRPPGYL